MHYTEFGDIPEQLADNWNGEISTFSYHKNSSDILYKEDEIIVEELKKGRVVVANKIGEIESVKVSITRRGMVILDVEHPSVKYIDAFAAGDLDDGLNPSDGENLVIDILEGFEMESLLHCTVYLPVKVQSSVRASVWSEKYRTKIILLERSDLEE